MEAHSLKLHVYRFDVGFKHGKITKNIYIYLGHFLIRVCVYVDTHKHTHRYLAFIDGMKKGSEGLHLFVSFSLIQQLASSSRYCERV